MRDAVAPVLQELGRRPGVVDLIEMHLVRLGQPERAQQERPDDQQHDEEEVEPVESPASLGAKRGAAVRTDRGLDETGPEPADDAHLPERDARRPGRDGRRTCTGGRTRSACDSPARDDDHRWRQRGLVVRRRRRSGDRRTPGCLRPLAVSRRRDQSGGQPVPAAGPQLQERPAECTGVQQRQDDDDRLGSDRRTQPKPVRDRRIVRVERGQDDVHVRERRHGQHDIRDPPAGGDRGEDDAHREEWVAVPLVDPCRHDEEGQGQDSQSDEEREPVRAAGGDHQDQRDHRQQQGRPDGDRRDRPEHGRARSAVTSGAGVVADPLAGVGEALAELRWDERPGVVGVDREVRVATGGHTDLLEQTRRDVRRLAARLDDRQPERQAQGDGRQEPRESRRQDADRVPGAFRVAEAAGRPERPPDRDHRHERDEDPELRLDDRRDDRVDRGALWSVAPQLAQPEQDEDHTERVRLAPHDAVEP